MLLASLEGTGGETGENKLAVFKRKKNKFLEKGWPSLALLCMILGISALIFFVLVYFYLSNP